MFLSGSFTARTMLILFVHFASSACSHCYFINSSMLSKIQSSQPAILASSQSTPSISDVRSKWEKVLQTAFSHFTSVVEWLESIRTAITNAKAVGIVTDFHWARRTFPFMNGRKYLSTKNSWQNLKRYSEDVHFLQTMFPKEVVSTMLSVSHMDNQIALKPGAANRAAGYASLCQLLDEWRSELPERKIDEAIRHFRAKGKLSNSTSDVPAGRVSDETRTLKIEDVSEKIPAIGTCDPRINIVSLAFSRSIAIYAWVFNCHLCLNIFNLDLSIICVSASFSRSLYVIQCMYVYIAFEKVMGEDSVVPEPDGDYSKLIGEFVVIPEFSIRGIVVATSGPFVDLRNCVFTHVDGEICCDQLFIDGSLAQVPPRIGRYTSA